MTTVSLALPLTARDVTDEWLTRVLHDARATSAIDRVTAVAIEPITAGAASTCLRVTAGVTVGCGVKEWRLIVKLPAANESINVGFYRTATSLSLHASKEESSRHVLATLTERQVAAIEALRAGRDAESRRVWSVICCDRSLGRALVFSVGVILRSVIARLVVFVVVHFNVARELRHPTIVVGPGRVSPFLVGSARCARALLWLTVVTTLLLPS